MDGFRVIAGEQAIGGGMPPGSHDAALLVVHGPGIGRLFGVDAGALSVGRGEESDVRLDAEYVLEGHAQIVRGDRGIFLTNAMAGTLVNEEPTQEQRLHDGDVIRVGRAALMLLFGGDIQRKYEEELRRLATVDTLTLAFNRRYFGTVLEHELDRSRRHDRPVSLLMLGIDRFADYNTEHGRLEGDAILRSIAELARDTVRHGAVVARHESDVFVAILPSTRTEQATAVGDTLRQNVARTLPVTISVAVASWDGVMDAAAFVSGVLQGLRGPAAPAPR